MDYIPKPYVCQVHFVPKSYDKMSKNLEKFGSFVIFYLKRYKKISKLPQKDLFGYMVFVIWGMGVNLYPWFFQGASNGRS
jgi:hypothetical protein